MIFKQQPLTHKLQATTPSQEQLKRFVQEVLQTSEEESLACLESEELEDLEQVNSRDFKEPFELFKNWYQEAQKLMIDYPDAAVLATVSQESTPSARTVLSRFHDDFNGFEFYTNYRSQKGQALEESAKASLCWYWRDLKKQVRVDGQVQRLSDEESDRYFDLRPRESQIGAWASLQSTVMELLGPEERERVLESLISEEGVLALNESELPNDLQVRYRFYELKFLGRTVPRPSHWGGFLLRPQRIEFWEEKPYRLHLRQEYKEIESLGLPKWERNILFP